MAKFSKDQSTNTASPNYGDGGKEIPEKDVRKAMNKKGSLKENLNSMRWS